MDNATTPNPSSTAHSNEPSVLCDVLTAVAHTRTMPETGVFWRLAESGRQLDANLVHLVPRQRVGSHVEPDLDVLLAVVSGTGSLATDNGSLPLTAGLLAWLPRGATRGIAAGDAGLAYLTVHTRRPGMQISHA